jgi:hypothetical protein
LIGAGLVPALFFKEEGERACSSTSSPSRSLHGVGHVAGILSAWTSVDSGFTDRPWIFSKSVTMKSLLGRLWGLFWLVALVCLVAAGLGIAFEQA